MQAAGEVVVIVLTFRDQDLTVDCVRSLQASNGVSVVPLVVDNASGGGNAEALRRRLPGVEVLAQSVNAGYTGGNNAGLAWARQRRSRYALVLNNDTIVAPDCIARLVEEAEHSPRAALVSPRIMYHEPDHLLWFGGGTFSLWTGRPTSVGRKRPAAFGLGQPADITFATGCAVLVRMSALNSLGMLDESFFGYSEDVDWSVRARAAGFRIRYVPSAVIWHREGISHQKIGGQALRQYLSARNAITVMRKHARWYHWPTFALTFLVDHVARFVLLSLLRRNPAAALATLRGVVHAFTGTRDELALQRPVAAAPAPDTPRAV